MTALLLCTTVVLVWFALGVGYSVGKAKERRRVESLNEGAIDYKQRWLEAVAILDGDGRLTPEQAKAVGLPTAPSLPQSLWPSRLAEIARRMDRQDQALRLSKPKNVYKSMTSADRKTLAVSRAENQLEDDDDLEGMTSGDKAVVLIARDVYKKVYSAKPSDISHLESDV